MSLADYYLPAQSVIVDGTSQPEYCRASDLQFRGVKEMLNQRRVAIGLAPCRIVRALPRPNTFTLSVSHSPGDRTPYGFTYISGPAYHEAIAYCGIIHGSRVLNASASVTWSADIDISSWTKDSYSITIPAGAEDVTIYANADGQSPTATAHLYRGAGFLADFQRYIEETLVYYLNHDVHPDGDIEGLLRPNDGTNATGVGYTKWTKSTLFSYLGIGVDGDWTVIPARNPFGLSALGGGVSFYGGYGGLTSAIMGEIAYKEQINEMVQVLDALRYIPFQLAGTGQYYRWGLGQNPYGSPSCSNAYDLAVGAWNAYSWFGVPSTYGMVRSFSASYTPEYGGQYTVTLKNYKGSLTYDFSAISSATGKCYLSLRRDGLSSLGNSPPHSQPEFTWGEWAGADLTFGGVWTSPLVTNSDVMSENQCPSVGVGWSVSDYSARAIPVLGNAAVAIVKPNFTLTLP